MRRTYNKKFQTSRPVLRVKKIPNRHQEYVCLKERDPEKYQANFANRIAKAEQRCIDREAEGKTPYPRHYTRKFAADAKRLEAARQVRNERIRNDLERGGTMEVI